MENLLGTGSEITRLLLTRSTAVGLTGGIERENYLLLHLEMKATYKLKHWFNNDNEIELIPCVDVGFKKRRTFKTEDIFPNLNYTFTNSLALNKDYL